MQTDSKSSRTSHRREEEALVGRHNKWKGQSGVYISIHPEKGPSGSADAGADLSYRRQLGPGEPAPRAGMLLHCNRELAPESDGQSLELHRRMK